MKKNLPAKTPKAASNGQTPDIQRRINAGWLRLWKAVWPNIPPPVKVQSLKSKVQSRADRRPAGSRSLESKVQSLKSPGSAAGDYLSRFLCAVFALALLARLPQGYPKATPALAPQNRHGAWV